MPSIFLENTPLQFWFRSAFEDFQRLLAQTSRILTGCHLYDEFGQFS